MEHARGVELFLRAQAGAHHKRCDVSSTATRCSLRFSHPRYTFRLQRPPSTTVQKWSKGKVREKLQNAVMFDQKLYDRLVAEIPKMKLITLSAVSERLKVGGSLARIGLKELVNKGLIRVVSYHSKQGIYTRATNTE